MRKDVLKEANELINSTIAEVKKRKSDEAYMSFLATTISDLMADKLQGFLKETALSKEQIKDILKEVKIETINNLPEVKVPEANVNVSIPEIKVPKAEVDVKMPDIPAPIVNIKPPIVNVPAPIVNVPAPIVNIEPTIIPEFPKEMEVKGLKGIIEKIVKVFTGKLKVSLIDSELKEPLPVMLMDAEGKPYKASMSVVSRGGGGNTTQLNPLDVYSISDKDDDASPNYFGFLDKDGNWYILKETISAGNDTYRYTKGVSDYATNWTNRASLTYQNFNAVF